MSLNLDNLKLVVICGPHPREKSGGESGWLDPDVEYDEDEEHFNTEFGFMTVHFYILLSWVFMLIMDRGSKFLSN